MKITATEIVRWAETTKLDLLSEMSTEPGIANGVQVVGGSNPLAPTKFPNSPNLFLDIPTLLPNGEKGFLWPIRSGFPH